MSKLTYWKMNCVDDSDCYSLRFRTKREAMAAWNAYQAERPFDGAGQGLLNFEPPYKVEHEYEGGAFGLMMDLTGESRNGWD